MDAQPEHIEQRRVDLRETAVGANADHRVVARSVAQRPVNKLGGESRIGAAQAALAKQCGKQQVGVGIPAGDGTENVVRGAPGWAGSPSPAALAGLGRAGSPALAGLVRAGPGALPGAWSLPRPAARRRLTPLTWPGPRPKPLAGANLLPGTPTCPCPRPRARSSPR